jgi:hypothetical protein
MSNLLKKYPSSLSSIITLLQRNNIRGSLFTNYVIRI